MKNIKIEYQCPRCKGEQIQNYNLYIKCMDCNLEFDKRDIRRFDEEDVLALSEKFGILRVLSEQHNEKITDVIFHDL